MNKETEKRKKDKVPFPLLCAFYISGGWFLFIFVLAYFNYSLNSPATVNLNELGDFFAGASSPLAIFWLVMVYMQQKREMGEISESAQKQVNIMQKQLNSEYEPMFVCYSLGTHADKTNKIITVTIGVMNFGNTAIYPRVEWDRGGTQKRVRNIHLKKFMTDARGEPYREHVGSFSYIEKKNRLQIIVVLDLEDNKPGLYKFSHLYSDSTGRKFKHLGQYSHGDENQLIEIFPEPAVIIKE